MSFGSLGLAADDRAPRSLGQKLWQVSWTLVVLLCLIAAVGWILRRLAQAPIRNTLLADGDIFVFT